MGKNKYIETPEKMWGLFCLYKESVNSTPFLVPDWVGKDAQKVNREHMKVLTMEGFECYVMDHTDITYPDLSHYFASTGKEDDTYRDYFAICTRIRRKIRRDQIEKGLSGLANTSITNRLNNLTERVDQTTNGKEISNQPLQIEIVKPDKEED